MQRSPMEDPFNYVMQEFRGLIKCWSQRFAYRICSRPAELPATTRDIESDMLCAMVVAYRRYRSEHLPLREINFALSRIPERFWEAQLNRRRITWPARRTVSLEHAVLPEDHEPNLYDTLHEHPLLTKGRTDAAAVLRAIVKPAEPISTYLQGEQITLGRLRKYLVRKCGWSHRRLNVALASIKELNLA